MKKYVLLDRDGTIIVNKHYQRDPELTELLPNARAGLRLLRDAGYGLVVVTNQSGIGRGLLAREDLAAVNRRMVLELGGGDDFFEGIYYCPHIDSDACRCRKPLPGMLERASQILGFDLWEAYMIGDSPGDIQAGSAVGAATILVRTGRGEATESEGKTAPVFIADDLLQAAEWIIARDQRRNGPPASMSPVAARAF